MNKKQVLEEEFSKGKIPNTLDGFYKGELSYLIPIRIREMIGGIFFQFWLPWKGKRFDSKTHLGLNVIPAVVAPLFRFRFKKDYPITNNTIQVFPFKTKIAQSLEGNQKVLQLDYNREENPATVRSVIDELVEVEKNSYLGKAYIIENKIPRLVAFFRLRK